MPNHYVGDLLHTMGMSGLSRVRTERSRTCPSVSFVCGKGLGNEIAEPRTDLLVTRVIGILECLEQFCRSLRPRSPDLTFSSSLA